MKKNNTQKNMPVTVEVLDLRLGDMTKVINQRFSNMMKVMDGRFEMLIASMNTNFREVRADIVGIKGEVSGIKQDMVHMESRLTTKIETEVGGLAIITGRSFKHVEKEIRDIQSRFPLESMV